MRLDVYPDEDKLAVLEVNTAFVDGWGTALNLNRATGEVLDTTGVFPDRFGLMEERYRPELALLLGELAVRGQRGTSLEEWSEQEEAAQETPIYVYGRRQDETPLVLPRDGLKLDNKLILACFSPYWEGDFVEIPETFAQGTGTPWDEVPADVYLKFIDKSSPEAARARASVIRGKPSGKAPFLRRAYTDDKLIAQRIVPQYIEETGEMGQRAAQLVVLAKGDFLTGYVQYGLGTLINDDSIHGPLRFAPEGGNQ
jgi:hypothetical protein